MKIRHPKVCIFGPGVVGYATGVALKEKGIEVGFVGRNEEKIKSLQKEGFVAYTFDSYADKAFDYDISFITIATPSVNGEIQLEPVRSVAQYIGEKLAKRDEYHVVVVKSTVVPGTTRQIVIPLLEKYSGKKAGVDFGVCMNPEYLREVSAVEDSRKPWFIVLGQLDEKSGEALSQVFVDFDCPKDCCSLEEAEMQKYVHNLFNATKISFFNEMRQIAKSIGADPDRMFKYTAISCEGIWNATYGLKDFGPYTGSCLPKDTTAFYAWATQMGYDVDVLGATMAANKKIHEKEKVKEDTVVGASL